jgi:hypothetical protein
MGSESSGTIYATGALGATAVVLAPIAAWQFGGVGVGLLAAFAAVIAATGWFAQQAEARFARGDRPVAGLLAASGVRMAVPLVVALLFVTLGRAVAPVSAVLLLVPLYLCSLLAETYGHVRPNNINPSNPRAA